ncbi:MAG: hypothetical protein M1577_04400 [Chloroflexi bacterium]|nr:hypothetical protein [Chloroflexota bacterium]
MQEEEHIFTTSVGEGRLQVRATAIRTANGLIVHILGGEHPHIGAVALAIPRPSLADPARMSATASVLTVIGHKEDEIVKPISESLAARLNQVVVVVAGLHVERASASEIQTLIHHSKEAAEALLGEVQRTR